ncbi:ABC transporter ATP-binding protein [Meiothermus granaticius]|uniref:ABC transporter ATP-binding protein n=1 Tax=Meiothermus granaticius TaxID=863370 RepID=UPI0011951072|nr:ABC transporter ATP-binding protein [Meiothermus granaticius]GEM87315.1 amino acid ABC transporter ATP-binding protein [Meiothermus granaticius NBRC 107808]
MIERLEPSPSPPRPDAAAIRFERVVKRYDRFEALKGVSLEVTAGQLVALLGPSGCGKTTLLRTVNRLVEPSEGTVYLGGRDVRGLDEVELRRGIGYVIQSIGLFPHMTVLENVMVVPRLLGWNKTRREPRAREMLALVGLEPALYAHRYPRQLSGGQAQRVGLARALAADPPVLLMDEPFAAVDPPTRERLQDEFLRLQAELQKTVLFVTHDLEEAVKLADRIGLMNMGQIEQYDPPSELLGHPKTEFVRGFLGPARTLLRLSRLPLEGLIEPLGPRSPAVQIPQTAMAREAFSSLLAHGGRELGVTDGNGQVIGVVRLETLLQAASEEG